MKNIISHSRKMVKTKRRY